MIGSGYAIDAVRRILHARDEHRARLDERHDRRMRHARARRYLTAAAHEGKTGAGTPRSQPIEFLPSSGPVCPGCAGPFAVADVDGIKIDTCSSCGSIWFDAGELKTLAHQPRDVPDEELISKRSRCHCPVSSTGMFQHLYRKPHRLLVDTCPNGHGVYLEQGEYLEALRISEEDDG